MRETMILMRISWIEEAVKSILQVTDPVFEKNTDYQRHVGEIFESVAEIRDEIGNPGGQYSIINYFCPDGCESLVVNYEGETLRFNTFQEALDYAEENMQKDFYKIIEV